MWRSVFLHEFLRQDIRNFQAVGGSFTASTSLAPPPGASEELPAVRLYPLELMRFDLTEPWDDVIGVSGRVRLRLPAKGIHLLYRGLKKEAEAGSDEDHLYVSDPVPIMRVGEGLQLALQFQPPPWVATDQLALLGKGILRVGQSQVALASFAVPHEAFIDLRFDWHTSGQARLLVNGHLVGYHNAIAPGIRIALPNMVIGNAPLVRPPRSPYYDVARVFLRALRRPDSLVKTVGLIGDVEMPDDKLLAKCIDLRTTELLALCDRLRAFMAQFNSQRTSPGEEMAGTLQASFSGESVAAHELAVEAFEQLAQMLKSADFSGSEAFLDTFTSLLEILHDALPQEFEALVADQLDASHDECQELGEKVIELNRGTLGPLIQLLNDAAERMKTVAGVA